jgi:hypothetical protein
MRDARPRLTQCPYCLGEFPDDEMTDDHVIACSWFPGQTTRVAKWVVRSCGACNHEKSALEGDALVRLALCLDPKRPELEDIIARASRSMDPRFARNARDAKHRFNKREAIRNSIIGVDSKRDAGVLPYFEDNFEAGSRDGILIPSESLDGVVQRWVRGIHLLEVGQSIPREYEVSVIHAGDEIRAQALSSVIQHAKIIQKGPGVEVKIVHAEEPEEFGAIYAFNIWDQLKCMATVLDLRSQDS